MSFVQKWKIWLCLCGQGFLVNNDLKEEKYPLKSVQSWISTAQDGIGVWKRVEPIWESWSLGMVWRGQVHLFYRGCFWFLWKGLVDSGAHMVEVDTPAHERHCSSLKIVKETCSISVVSSLISPLYLALGETIHSSQLIHAGFIAGTVCAVVKEQACNDWSWSMLDALVKHGTSQSIFINIGETPRFWNDKIDQCKLTFLSCLTFGMFCCKLHIFVRTFH